MRPMIRNLLGGALMFAAGCAPLHLSMNAGTSASTGTETAEAARPATSSRAPALPGAPKGWDKVVFSSPEIIKGNAYSLATGDFNGDGKADLAFVGYASGTKEPGVFISLSNGDGTFSQPVVREIRSPGYGLAAGDFNSDKGLDLVTISSNGSADDDGNLFSGKATGAFQRAKSFPVRAGELGSHTVSLVVAADLNGDGISDLLINTGSISLALGSKSGRFSGYLKLKNVTGDYGIAVADMNGDGSPDIVTAKADGKACVSFNHNGQIDDEPACEELTPTAAELPMGGIGVGDLNGDGRPDVAVGCRTSSGLVIDVFPNKGDGTLDEPLKFPLAENGGTIGAVLVGDIDGDGKNDVVAYQNENLVYVFPGNGNGKLSRPVKLSLGLANFNSGVNLVLGDFKHNGTLGLAAKHLDPQGDDWIEVITISKRH